MVCSYNLERMMVLSKCMKNEKEKLKKKKLNSMQTPPYTRTKQCPHCERFLNLKDRTQRWIKCKMTCKMKCNLTICKNGSYVQ